MKKGLKSIILIFGILLSFSLSSVSNYKSVLLSDQKETYLNESQILDYLIKADSYEIKELKNKPFDTLQFNKVIAYDFEGTPWKSVFNQKNNKYSDVITNQKKLNIEQIYRLVNLLTNPETYGSEQYECFNPHQGIIFYDNEKVKLVIDICLDCNYLVSSIKIPTVDWGFSDEGIKNIIDLSKDLGLNYGNIKK
ncbi:hypothetical protein [Aureivirga sp. CE67]|uniref:hypothetical protein n=1 Tax=Aureivirga sp. CE67 TaxID=1788983 RepID=UPI0018C8DD83|nr:hypothetical protein [Aureivirga sp. CE67]